MQFVRRVVTTELFPPNISSQIIVFLASLIANLHNMGNYGLHSRGCWVVVMEVA
jgi:hypothetical protein